MSDSHREHARTLKYEDGTTRAVLAVVGSKGGTGTTTTALGVAAALREPTYIVDADRSAPTLTDRCGVTTDQSDDSGDRSGDGRSAVDRGGRRRPPDAPSVPPTHSPPDAPSARPEGDRSPDVPLPARLARPVPAARFDGLAVCDRTAVVPAIRGRRRPRLARILRACRASPRRTIVDCPAGRSRRVTRTLRVADHALVTTQPTPLAVRAARQTVRIARTVGTPVGLVSRASRLTDRSPSDAFTDPLDPSVVARVPTVDPPVFAADRVRTAHRRICDSLPDEPRARPDGARRPAHADGPHNGDGDPHD